MKSAARQPAVACAESIETTAWTVPTCRLDEFELSAVNDTAEDPPGVSWLLIVPCRTSVPLALATLPEPEPEPVVVQYANAAPAIASVKTRPTTSAFLFGILRNIRSPPT